MTLLPRNRSRKSSPHAPARVPLGRDLIPSVGTWLLLVAGQVVGQDVGSRGVRYVSIFSMSTLRLRQTQVE